LIVFRRVFSFAFVAFSISACALLVPEELGSITCRDEGAVGEPACARGDICQGGECRRCAPSETCGDGLDNDCNGAPDDGCPDALGGAAGAAGESGDSGAAGDAAAGMAGAGGKAGSAGKSGAAGKAGAGGKAGAAGKGGAGGAGGKGGTSSAGASGMAGAAGSGAAGSAGAIAGAGGAAPLPDGAPCETDGACEADSVCSSLAQLGAVPVAAVSPDLRVCSRACRTSADCAGTLAICQPTPSGAAVCVAPEHVGRSPAGKLVLGSDCTDATQCRSAWCEGGTCRDTCATSSDCSAAGANNKCIAEMGIPGAPDQLARRCGKAPGLRGAADICEAASQCVENDCRTLDSAGSQTFAGFTCTASCCTTDDCSTATFSVGGTKDVTFFRICSYESGMRACSSSNSEVGPGLLGTSCQANSECRSLFCLEERCSDACCSDSSCDTVAQPGLRCLPTLVQEKWQLRCRLP
jgi:hypothetical protein